MTDRPFVYLTIPEYEVFRSTGMFPENPIFKVVGYWVNTIPVKVYELEYRGLVDAEESMSTYIIWDLTDCDTSGKL